MNTKSPYAPKPHDGSWTVVAFYRFVRVDDVASLQRALKKVAQDNNVCGTTLIAPEGINGTMAAPDDVRMAAFLDVLDAHAGVRQGEVKFSAAAEQPFQRLKIRAKKEIITMKAPEADPTKQVGAYVEARDWNDLIAQDDVVVLDTRNTYETEFGMFEGAVDPRTNTFTEFKDFVQKNLDPRKHKKIAMYCTGGIRCEKASSYMMAHGFEEVYHLKGGILKYLEDIAPPHSKWNGTCFVFDERAVLATDLSAPDAE